jgi:predicted ATP-grasp superfamily ATP-dependent carboligase
MTRVFVFESLMAGPLDTDTASAPSPSLLREGRAMLLAIVRDLAAVSGVEVTTLLAFGHDAQFKRVPCHAIVAANTCDRVNAFDRLAAAADWSIIIAPELDGELARRCRRVLSVGGQLLGPKVEHIELLSDKQRTAEYLATSGVPVCQGQRLSAGPIDRDLVARFPFPAVAKPLDGCGSIGVRLVASTNELTESETPRRIEKYAPGLAASIAAICGPDGFQVLPPCTQQLSNDGTFRYSGGSSPIAPTLAARATALARRSLDALPGLVGYVGIDLVLGDDHDGSDDVVIEINPRLTTSYVGLRELAETNLVLAMLDAAMGRPANALSFRPGRVEFDCGGTVKYYREERDRGVATTLAGTRGDRDELART